MLIGTFVSNIIFLFIDLNNCRFYLLCFKPSAEGIDWYIYGTDMLDCEYGSVCSKLFTCR